MKATFTGWSCVAGPAELVDYLTDPNRAEELSYEEFAEEVNLSGTPLDEGQLELLPTDWHVTWLRTELPSGQRAWVMQHSGIEFLFAENGTFDEEAEGEGEAAVRAAY